MRRYLAIGVATAALLVTTPSQAFGLRTHLYISDQVWADVNDDCRVGLGGDTVPIDTALCRAIQTNRGAFLAGAIGPDAFPDLLIGQNYVHPGTPDGRQTADWLQLVIEEAETPEEMAFAYGQLIHAAGDTFAHSYVNNYAGGVFELTARFHKDVELRHFQLEKYIDQHLDYRAPVDELVVPSGLLVRSMVETHYLPGEVSLTREDLESFGRGPRAVTGRVARILAAKSAKAAPASHMTAMRTMLVLTEDTARQVVCEDVRATQALATAYREYNLAEAHARGATISWPSPEAVIMTEPCGPDEVAAAEAALASADALRDQLPWSDRAINDRDAWLAALDPGVRQRLVDASQTYEVALGKREKTKAVAAFAPQWRDDVRKAIEAYMQASLASARIMVRNSEPMPLPRHRQRGSFFPYEAWWDCYGPVFSGEPLESAQARCRRIEAVGVDESLSDVALRTGIGQHPRSILLSYLRLQDWVEGLRNDILLGIARPANPAAVELGEGMLEPIRVTRDKLNHTFQDGRSGQITFRCVADSVDVDLGLLSRREGDWLLADEDCRERPEGGEGTGQYFDPQEFVPVRHAVTLGKLALVGRGDLGDLAERWAGERPTLGSNGASGRYSVILDMARSLDGSQQWRSVSLPTPTAGRIPAAPVPTHGAGYPVPAPNPLTHLNIDPAIDRTRPGFAFYQTVGLRSRGFARLFPEPFEGEILRRREFGADWYPFRPCDGDPFRPLPDPDARITLCDPVPTQTDVLAEQARAAAERARAALTEAFDDQIQRCFGLKSGRPPQRQSGCLR